MDIGKNDSKVEDDEVRYYQPRFKRWIVSDKWDEISERLTDDEMNIIIQVMNSKKDGDCSWVIWRSCNAVLSRIREINKKGALFKSVR